MKKILSGILSLFLAAGLLCGCISAFAEEDDFRTGNPRRLFGGKPAVTLHPVVAAVVAGRHRHRRGIDRQPLGRRRRVDSHRPKPRDMHAHPLGELGVIG